MCRSWAWLSCTLAALLALYTGETAGEESLEYPIKAAFLSKFGQFISWPDWAFSSPASPMSVCVMGADPFGPALDRIAETQMVGERPIAVRRLAWSDAALDCHILYISAGNEGQIQHALQSLRGLPVLTVTDAASTGDTRGIIHFAVDENRVRFHIDDRAAADNGLTISSKLLGLALSVMQRD